MLRLTAEIDAEDADALAVKLNDIAYELVTGRMSPKSVFASPSCRGTVTLGETDG